MPRLRDARSTQPGAGHLRSLFGHTGARVEPGTIGAPRTWAPFVAAGAALVLAGGFVAAAGGEAPSRHLSWACAYLVLVCGSAQVFLGGGQALIASRPPRPLVRAAQFGAFNLGNAGVLAGTLSGVTGVLGVGSAVLVVALGLFAWATRDTVGPRLRVVVYRLVLVALAVSVPVGGALAH